MMVGFLMVLAPLTLMAQEPAGASNGNNGNAPPPAGYGLRDVSNDFGKQRQPAPAPAPDDRQRRGSMVGYIDDALIASKLRIRFDAGFENNVPDRAEFFYPQCGCFGGEAPGPQPGAASDLNYRQLQVWGEYAVNNRFSAFVQVPLRWIQPQDFIIPGSLGEDEDPFSDQGGFGDMRVGVKAGLVASSLRQLTLQAQLYFPTGDASKGLGTDHASLEPALLYYQRLSDVVVLESQAGVWIPLGGSSGQVAPHTGEDFAGNVFFYGIGSAFEIYNRPRLQFAPVVELVGWRITSGLQTLEGPPGMVDLTQADGTNILNLKIGARISLDRGSFYVGYGHGLTDATWYDHILRLEYRLPLGR